MTNKVKMADKSYKYIYGPVFSWRLGYSLGVDPISSKNKICSFDCIYCQLGKTKVLTKKRKIFVPTAKIIEEIKSLPVTLKIDYITFSGTGEPTLAKNLGEITKEIRKIRKEKIAILTNSCLMDEKDVQKDLLLMDFVIAKLDAHTQDLFGKINRPVKSLKLEKIFNAIKGFKNKFNGKLALQIMFTKENERYAQGIAKIAKNINPDEIQLNTPLRPCAVKPLSKKRLDAIKRYFKGANSISVYDVKKKKAKPMDKEATLLRRPQGSLKV